MGRQPNTTDVPERSGSVQGLEENLKKAVMEMKNSIRAKKRKPLLQSIRRIQRKGRLTVGQKVIAENRKARHDYFILESLEAGIALTGTEVKSMRAGRVNLKDSYIFIQNNEVFIEGMHVSPYEQGNRFNVDPLRKRKLLLHKKEILKLRAKTQEQGLGIVPLKLYFKDDKVKVEIAIVRGKKLYDKRATEAKKSAEREIHRVLREREKR